MGLALHAYNDEHGLLPPAVVHSDDGTPLLSWRVLILPYIEQKELFDQFKLDEPWNSPHNIKLLPKMPITFAPPPGKMKLIPAHHTVVHIFVGKGTPFEEGANVNLRSDVPDGTLNTILTIEAGKAVPWTKPENLTFHPGEPLPDLRGLFEDDFRVGLACGSMRWVSKGMSENSLRLAIMRNDGKVLGADWNE